MSAWWQNPWLPWNYPKDLSNSFMQQLENGLLYIFAMVLNAILTAISSVFGWMMSIFQGMVSMLFSSALALGPWGLSVVVIGTAAAIGGAFVVFQLLKDTPVVGAFV